MIRLYAIWIFYRKLLIPSLLLSPIFGLLGMTLENNFSLKKVGLSFTLISLLIHYYIYELRNYNEYYFYFNLGLSKKVLWSFTLILGVIIGLIISNL